jgi:glycosyltransferase involved in cell wall biosynthesis
MHILIVTDAWRPQVNGVVRTLETVCALLARKGHRISFITPEKRQQFRLPLVSELNLTRTSAAEIGREIDALSPEAIQIATEGPLGWAARCACLRRGLPFTTGFHTRFAEYAAARLPLPGVAGLGWSILRRFHAPSRGVMVPTRSIGEELSRRRFGNVRVWTRGVDHELFRPYDRRHLDLPRPILLYSGRLAIEKGVEDFLRVQLSGTKVLVGDGPERQRLAARFQDAVFLGFRHGEDYARTLEAADVLVFPSRTDTFGLVMLEAIACGTPVAAHDVPSPIDVIENGVTGVLSRNLTEATRQALHLDREAVRAGSRQFSWERAASLFESWLAPIPRALAHGT